MNRISELSAAVCNLIEAKHPGYFFWFTEIDINIVRKQNYMIVAGASSEIIDGKIIRSLNNLLNKTIKLKYHNDKKTLRSFVYAYLSDKITKYEIDDAIILCKLAK